MATALRAMHLTGSSSQEPRFRFLGMPFDAIDQATVLRDLRACRSGDPFRYIVTPNVDHVIRASRNKSYLPCYESASQSLCDSTPITRLARLLGIDLPLVTGSDLTASVFRQVMEPGDQITLIASNPELVRDLERTFPNMRFRSHVPPYGVAQRPDLLEECATFVMREKARFSFIAIGSPQSEMIAQRLAQDPEATGVALCIGAGLEFLVETKKRAPLWMRKAGLEWLHRLASEPRRLWRRYVFALIPLARLFTAELAKRGRRAY